MDSLIATKIKQLLLAGILTFPAFTVDAAETRIIWILAIAILVDSILGVATAIRQRRFASWRMGQPMAKKITLYGFALSGAFLASEAHPYLFWTLEYTGVYFVLSEVLSIFEKLALWGLELPARLLGTVNELFHRYKDGDKESETTILNKS